jgi:hypothetical protein
MTRADLDKAPQDVASMFDTVAERYDLTNDVLSVGQDRAHVWLPVTLEGSVCRSGYTRTDAASPAKACSEVPGSKRRCTLFSSLHQRGRPPMGAARPARVSPCRPLLTPRPRES